MKELCKRSKPNKIITYVFFISLFFLFQGISYGQYDPFSNWNWRNPLPQGNPLRDVTYANGLFVAVGDFGTIVTSPDGVNWTLRKSGTRKGLLAVTYGNSLFVAAGEDMTILTSPDGIDWTYRYSNGGFVPDGIDIAYGNGTFAAVGLNTEAVIVTSTDGINWTARDPGVNMTFSNIVYGNSMFCAVNWFGHISTSRDGIHWTDLVSIHLSDAKIAFGDSLFAIVSFDGHIHTSQDGLNWTQRASYLRPGAQPKKVIYARSKFVAVGWSGVIATSNDGITWTSPPVFSYTYLEGITYGNSNFVAVGLDAGIWISPDAEDWRNVIPNKQGARAIAKVNSRLVSAGGKGTIMTSENGETWTRKDSGTTSYLFGIAYGQSQLAAVGENGVIITSPNGDQWTARNSGTSEDLNDIVYGNSLFVAVGDSGFACYSADGENWAAVHTGVTGVYTADNLEDITFGNDTFAAVTSNDIIFSTNGQSWQILGNPFQVSLENIEYGGGIFVITSYYGDIMTSPNLVHWTPRSSFPYTYPNAISYVDSFFAISAVSGRLLTSTDGITWNLRNDLPVYGFTQMIHFNSTYIIVSGNGTILQTDPFFSIAGNAGIGSRLTYDVNGPQVSSTGASGNYSFYVPGGWSGTVTPELRGHVFTPPRRIYSNIGSDYTGQNYTPSLRSVTISGTVTSGTQPLSGVILSFSHDNHTETTDTSGVYSYTVPFGTSTTITPSKTGYAFTPSQHTLTGILQHQSQIDFSGTSTTPVSVAITSPTPGETVSGIVFVNADASSSDAGISYVDFYINNQKVKRDTLSPYRYRWETTEAANGQFAIFAEAADQNGNSNRHTITVTVANTVEPPHLTLNRDRLNFGATTGSASPLSTGPQEVSIGNSGGGYLNWTASTSTSWINVSPTSGTGNGTAAISIDTSGISPGTYTGTVEIADPAADNSPVEVDIYLTVKQTQNETPPFGSLDIPSQAAVVSGNVPVSGWVLDDIEVKDVKLYHGASGTPGNGLVYIGDAQLTADARPDISGLYPGYPFHYRAGWGYLLPTMGLPGGGNGPYTITAIASDYPGNSVILGSVTITCDNSSYTQPFGTIETPAPNETVSGSQYINWGWALTPQPNTIPYDGSTIKLYIDGQPVEGNPVYNIYRADIAVMFPGYNNSGGALGYFIIDTTLYENGVHTISWTVTDDAGNTAGIGSRYFTINNPGSSTEARHK